MVMVLLFSAIHLQFLRNTEVVYVHQQNTSYHPEAEIDASNESSALLSLGLEQNTAVGKPKWCLPRLRKPLIFRD